jgi:hypothetical protein
MQANINNISHQLLKKKSYHIPYHTTTSRMNRDSHSDGGEESAVLSADSHQIIAYSILPASEAY